MFVEDALELSPPVLTYTSKRLAVMKISNRNIHMQVKSIFLILSVIHLYIYINL